MKRIARARKRTGLMNRTEARYAQYLENQRRTGQVLEYHYEATTLRIGDNCRYTPDFMVVNAAGEVEFHEIKGFWRDDARVKIKVAASKFPFRFVGVQFEKGFWVFEEFKGEPV